MEPPTLEGLAKEVRISLHLLDQKCTDEHLVSISLFLDWRSVAPHLGLSERDIEDIKAENTKESERRLKVLQTWRKKYGYMATFKSFINVLLAVGNADDAERVCRLLQTPAGSLSARVVSAGEFSASSSKTVSLLSESTPGSVSGSDHEVLVPQEQTDTSSSFPYLNIGKLSSRDKFALQSKLLRDSDNIMLEFCDLKHHTINSIVSRHISVKELHTRLSGLEAYRPTRKPVPLLRNQLDEIEKAEDVEGVFSILDKFYSFFNYVIIEKLIGWFGTPEDKERLETYTENFRRFCKRRTFECPSDIFGSVDKGKTVLVVKFEESWDPSEGCPVETVLRLCNSLADILEVEPVTLHLRQIDTGCVELQFQVPSFVEQDIFPLSVEQERALTAVGVTRLTCGSYSFPQPPESPPSDTLPAPLPLPTPLERRKVESNTLDPKISPSPQSIPSATPPAPLPLPTPLERSEPETNTFDMITALLSAGVPHIVEQILQSLDEKSLVKLEQVSSTWRNVIADLLIWKHLIKHKIDSDPLWRHLIKRRGWHKYLDMPPAEQLSRQFYQQLHHSASRDIHSLEANWRRGHYTLTRVQTGSAVLCLQYDDNKIVTGHQDSTIKIWDRSTLQLLTVLEGHKSAVGCLQYNEQVVISGSSDHTVKVWDIQTGQVMNDLLHHKGPVYSLKFTTDTLVTGSDDHTVAVWNVKSPTDITLRMTLKEHKRVVWSVAMTETTIISGSDDSTIKVRDAFTGELVRTLHGHSGAVYYLQLQGSHLISGHYKTIQIWNIDTGECIRKWHGHNIGVRCVAVDNKRIVCGSFDKTIKVWDLAAVLDPGSSSHTLCITTLKEHTGWVEGVQCDDFQIISGSQDGTLLVHDFLDPIHSPS